MFPSGCERYGHLPDIRCAGKTVGEREETAALAGIAELVPEEDRGMTVLCHGTGCGIHLAMGDVRRCATRVLMYLMASQFFPQNDV